MGKRRGLQTRVSYRYLEFSYDDCKLTKCRNYNVAPRQRMPIVHRDPEDSDRVVIHTG